MKYIGISNKVYNSLSVFAEATDKEVADVIQKIFNDFLASDEFNFTVLNYSWERTFKKLV